MPPTSRAPTLISIQLLRAVACLLVLLHHARNPKDWLFSPLAGWDFTTGVEIFFVISGFIMYAAARAEAPAEFMRRRVIRIAPLYAIATLTWAGWMALHGLYTDPGHLVMSLLIIPHASPGHPDLIWPVLSPGWTLCYEMFFYLLFTVGLATRRIGVATAGVILPLVTLGFLFDPQGAIPHAATAPILLAFLAGMGIAWAHERVSFAKAWPLAIAGAVALGLHASPWAELSKVSIVVASAALVAGALALEPFLHGPRLAPMRLVGDASYSIYLFHTLVLAQVMWTGYALPVGGWPQFLLLVGMGVVLSVAGGVAIHLWVERPMLKALLRLGGRAKPPARAPLPEATKVS